MKYRSDPKGLIPLLRSRELQDICVARAEAGAQWVRSRAPRDTGAYANGIRVTRGTSTKDGRVLAYLQATDPKSAAIEWGNRRTKAHHLLRSAIDVIEGRQG
jgi:hypothetical protein